MSPLHTPLRPIALLLLGLTGWAHATDAETTIEADTELPSITVTASQNTGQVGNEQILLGLTPGRITPLHVLKEPVTLPTTPQPATPEFAKRLLELMGNQKDKP